MSWKCELITYLSCVMSDVGKILCVVGLCGGFLNQDVVIVVRKKIRFRNWKNKESIFTVKVSE